MANTIKKSRTEQQTSLEELLTKIISLENAMANILVDKGIITDEELRTKVKAQGLRIKMDIKNKEAKINYIG